MDFGTRLKTNYTQKIVIFLFFVLNLLFSQVHAQLKPLELDDENKIYLIGPSAQIFKDDSGVLDISQITSSQYDTLFQDINANYPNLGVSDATFWIRFSLNSKINFRGFLFNIGYLFHDKLEMYKLEKGIPERIFFSDINQGLISHEHHKRDRFAVPMEFKEGEESIYYLAIRDHEGITLSLELSSEENFLKRQANDSLRIGIISGIFLLASSFALIIYFRDKQKKYLYFFLLNIFFILTQLCHNGNLQMLLWPGNLRLNHDFFIFAGFLTNALSFLFTSYFLELENRHPYLFLAGLFFASLLIIGGLSPLLGLDHHMSVFYYGMVLGSLFEMTASAISLRSGFKLAKQFLVSRLLFSSSILGFGLIKLNILPYPGPTFEFLGSIGVCFQVSLLAYVITDYRYTLEINQLSQEKDIEKQRIEQLEHANKVKTEFLGMASHDLKGPLRNISALASFIEKRQISSEEEIFHMSSMIRQSSEKLVRLVKDLLDNTAMEMGKLELKLVDIDPVKSIQSVISQYELEAKGKKQQLHLVVNLKQRLLIKADEIRFIQVVENLISNAIKFSPFDKNIWVIVSKPENANILIEVKDEGPGFTEEDKKFLFNYYKKLSAKPTGQESSSGLGLSIVKKIVDLHSGKIWLESQEGHGASFFIEF